MAYELHNKFIFKYVNQINRAPLLWSSALSTRFDKLPASIFRKT
jgi:hypothetical protein